MNVTQGPAVAGCRPAQRLCSGVLMQPSRPRHWSFVQATLSSHDWGVAVGLIRHLPLSHAPSPGP